MLKKILKRIELEPYIHAFDDRFIENWYLILGILENVIPNDKRAAVAVSTAKPSKMTEKDHENINTLCMLKSDVSRNRIEKEYVKLGKDMEKSLDSVLNLEPDSEIKPNPLPTTEELEPKEELMEHPPSLIQQNLLDEPREEMR